jgi:anaerobic magnesium-protoporphyrin IX monomethyl ester cyclase
MLFRGAYTTDFYREVRDLLHAEVNAGGRGAAAAREFDGRWAALERRAAAHRASAPDARRQITVA